MDGRTGGWTEGRAGIVGSLIYENHLMLAAEVKIKDAIPSGLLLSSAPSVGLAGSCGRTLEVPRLVEQPTVIWQKEEGCVWRQGGRPGKLAGCQGGQHLLPCNAVRAARRWIRFSVAPSIWGRRVGIQPWTVLDCSGVLCGPIWYSARVISAGW